VIAEGSPVDQVLRRRPTAGHTRVDLLNHDASLAVELLGVQPRAPDEVREQVDRLGGALGADRDVEGHQVVAGVGVQHASQPLGRLVDVLVGRISLAP